METWAVVNQKGGVGKTTTTLSLASILTLKQKRVLVVDLDPQGSLTKFLKTNINKDSLAVYGLFNYHNTFSHAEVTKFIQKTNYANLDILPYSVLLATLEKPIMRKFGMGLVLKKSFDVLDNLYDYIIIDCAPALGILMVNAIASSTLVLIPSQTEYLALKALDDMINVITMMCNTKALAHGLNYYILPTMYDTTTRAANFALKRLKKAYSKKVIDVEIPMDHKLRDASILGIPPALYAPQSLGVKSYMRVVNLILQEQAMSKINDMEK